MRSVRLAVCLTAVWAPAMALTTAAEVKIDPAFGDHMVLQRDMKVPVWGTGTPGDNITVSFGGQKKAGTVAKDGKWMIHLDPLKTGKPGELILQGTNTITLKDVLVGEVWLGSGQSNMGLVIREGIGVDPLLAAAAANSYPQIRHMTTGAAGKGWQEARPENMSEFSALLFTFGVNLHKELDVPVGLIAAAVGCSCAGHWVSNEAIEADPVIKEMRSHPGQEAVGTWVGSRKHTRRLGGLGCFYESRIRPVMPYAIRGVLWDQGECNSALRGTKFWEMELSTAMGVLIRGWRKQWGQGEFPFICVQKPSGPGCAWDDDDPVTRSARKFEPLPQAVPETGNGDYNWPGGSNALWCQDYLNLRLHPNTAVAISSDLGVGLHPPNKWGYGARLARVALGMVYGRKLEYYGPTYASHKIEGDKVRVSFSHVGQGLAWRHGEKLQGFAVAGEDKVFHWADAVIAGDTVVVASDKVKQPVAARYGWGKEYPWANLFNKDHLPAIPFRTDTW